MQIALAVALGIIGIILLYFAMRGAGSALLRLPVAVFGGVLILAAAFLVGRGPAPAPSPAPVAAPAEADAAQVLGRGDQVGGEFTEPIKFIGFSLNPLWEKATADGLLYGIGGEARRVSDSTLSITPDAPGSTATWTVLPDISDVIFIVDFRVDGPQETVVCITMRASSAAPEPDSGYRFCVSPAGEWFATKHSLGKVTELARPTGTTAVRDGWNTIAVSALGSRLRFFANEQILMTFTDAAVRRGRVTVGCGVPETAASTTTCTFVNANGTYTQIKRPSEEADSQG